MASELTITSIREDVRACAAPETHCSVLRKYRDSLDRPDVRTPLLCDANADARVVFIGGIGGEITFHRPGEAAYEYNQLCGNEYTLGWQSGINLAKLLHRPLRSRAFGFGGDAMAHHVTARVAPRARQITCMWRGNW